MKYPKVQIKSCEINGLNYTLEYDFSKMPISPFWLFYVILCHLNNVSSGSHNGCLQSQTTKD